MGSRKIGGRVDEVTTSSHWVSKVKRSSKIKVNKDHQLLTTF